MQHATQEERDDKIVRRPTLEQFLQAFLQERNIKWMLLVGAAIVVVCSLKLVAQQWDNWHLSVKFFSILAYVAAIFGFAEASERMLGLRATSTTLRGVTLFLIPISFLSIGWLSSQQSISLLAWFATVALGVAVASWIADSILKQLLSGRQPTYQICFMLLCVIGGIPDSYAIPGVVIASTTWLLGTLGIIKINRHIYWLEQQYRSTLAHRFFPVALMGLQMLLLFSAKLQWIESKPWLGLAIVLCAIPLAVTTKSLLKVYRSRTGGLLATWPASAAVSLVICLLMATTGVILASNLLVELGPNLMLLVPSCFLAAGIFGWAAFESKQPVFTAIGLVLILIGYVVSPAWFSDFARGVANTAAVGLNESKLPIAFYGLTCMPLMLGWSFAARWLVAKSSKPIQGDWSFFYRPLIWGANLLAIALLLISVSNTKAMFLIPVIYVVFYTAQALLWNDRRYMAGVLFSASVAVYSFIPFAKAMFGSTIDANYSFLLLGVWCNLLFVLPFDRVFQRLHEPRPFTSYLPVWRGQPIQLANVFGIVILTGISLVLMVNVIDLGLSAMTPAVWAWLAIVLAGHAICTFTTRSYIAGVFQGVVWTFAIGLAAALYKLNVESSIALFTAVTTIASAVGYLLTRNSDLGFRWIDTANSKELLTRRIRPAFIPAGSCWDAFFVPARDWFSVLAMACCGIHIAILVMNHLDLRGSPLSWPIALVMVWLAGNIVVVRLPVAVSILGVFLPLVITGGLIDLRLFKVDFEVLPFVWSIVLGCIALPVKFWFPRTADTRPLLKWWDATIALWFIGVLLLCSLPYDPLLAGAGALSLGIMYVLYQPPLNSRRFGVGAILLNCFLFLLVCQAIRISFWNVIFSAGWFRIYAVPVPLLSVFAFNLLVIQALMPRLNAGIRRFWEVVLVFMIARMLCYVCIGHHGQPGWIIAGGILLILLSTVELSKAFNYQREDRVWLSLAYLFGAIVLAMVQNPINSLVPLIPLGCTCLAIALAWASERSIASRDWKFANRPFRLAAMGITCCLAINFLLSHTLGNPGTNKSITTLCLFLGAFYTGMEGYSTRSEWSLWGFLVLINAGIASWTRTAGYNDFQFYLVPMGLSLIAMVELLRSRLPQATAQNMRLVGSLVILVSPMVQIVQGSWWHLISLMILSVLVMLLAIGMRIKVLMATGAAFLIIDLASILVRTAIDKPGALWVTGLSIGVVVIAMAAICEIYRDRIRARIRELSDELATWS